MHFCTQKNTFGSFLGVLLQNKLFADKRQVVVYFHDENYLKSEFNHQLNKCAKITRTENTDLKFDKLVVIKCILQFCTENDTSDCL